MTLEGLVIYNQIVTWTAFAILAMFVMIVIIVNNLTFMPKDFWVHVSLMGN